MRYQEPFYTKWAKGKVFTENWPDNVWTCEKNPKHWCLHEKSNPSSDRFSWIRSISKTTCFIFGGQNWPFLHLYHEAVDSSNFRSYSMRSEKLKNNPPSQSVSGCADPKFAPDLPSWPILVEYEKFLQHFLQQSVLRTGKKGSAIFHSRPNESWVNSWKR